MKPKYKNLLRSALPALIFIPAMSGLVTAAIILPNGLGDVIITTTVNNNNSGPNNILVANGQPLGAHEILLDPNAFLSPAGAASIDIRVLDASGASYTINMGAGSSINAGLNNGITTANTIGIAEDLLINANGTITGVNGISGGPGIINIFNTGNIIGTAGSGITSLGAINLTNTGLIQGTAGAFIGGISADTLNLNLGSRLIGDVNGGLGIDAINFGTGLTAIGGLGNSITGNVNGFETISKAGGGVAFIGLPGDAIFNVNTDTINITSGGLYINANITGLTGPLATINSGGAALGGTGIWSTDVFVTAGGISAGAIPINLDSNPVNAVGQVNILGDVDHSPGSFIRFDVVPQGGPSDIIVQTGVGNTYDVTGANLRISATSNNRVISNGTYTLVDSQEVITGVGSGALGMQFNPNVNGADTLFQGSEIFDVNPVTTTVLTNFFTTVGTENGGTNLVININHDFSNLPGLTPNEAAFGAALDASTNSPNPITQDFISALDYSDLNAVQATLASLIPDNVLNSVSAIASSNYHVHRIVQDHLAMTRTSETFSETQATTDSKGGTIPGQVSSNGSSMGNVWGTFSHNWMDSDYGISDIDGEYNSFTAGVDFRVSPNLLIGILLDGSSSDYDYNGGGSEIDSLRAAIYGTLGQSTGIYSDFLFGYGEHEMDLDRNLGGILAGTSYNASSDAESVQALLTLGYAMQSGSVKHGPFVGLEYQNIEADGFIPTGGPGLLGGVGGFEVDSLRLLAGYRAQATYGRFTPYGSVTYAHEFEDGPVSTTATIPGGGAAFSFNGGGVESAILISLGTNYAINDNLGLNAGYNGEISTGDGIDSHGLNVGLNYAF